MDKVDLDSRTYPSPVGGLVTLGILVLGYIVALVDRQIMSLLLPDIKRFFVVSDLQIGLLVGFAFAICYSLFGLPLGALADRVNRKWLIALGMVVWSSATIGCGLATSFGWLFIFRILVGFGEASFAPAAYSIISDTFAPRRLVWATSVLGLGGSLGSGVALILGGLVIDYFSRVPGISIGINVLAPWQATLFALSLPGFIVAVLILTIREPKRHRSTDNTPDLTGSFLSLALRWRDYLPLYLAGIGMATTAYCGHSWFPAYIMRQFGLSHATAGYLVGLIQIFSAMMGSLLAICLTEILLKYGYKDAHLRSVMIVASCTLLTMATFLMPTLNATLAIWTLSCILQHSHYGCLMAALQLSTPNHLRGTNSAIYLLLVALVALAGGSAGVGAISEFGFHGSPGGVGFGIALVGGAGAVLAALAARSGLKRFREIASRSLD